jgi:hypothetical protein
VAVSPGVLKVLLATEEAKEGLEYSSDSERNRPAELFHAAEVHLARPQEEDLVVIGVCPPMCGADNSWFWLVRSAIMDPQVVLVLGGSLVELLDSRTNGYRDVRCSWSSAAETRDTIYRFDGKQYKVWKDKRNELR